MLFKVMQQARVELKAEPTFPDCQPVPFWTANQGCFLPSTPDYFQATWLCSSILGYSKRGLITIPTCPCNKNCTSVHAATSSLLLNELRTWPWHVLAREEWLCSCSGKILCGLVCPSCWPSAMGSPSNSFCLVWAAVICEVNKKWIDLYTHAKNKIKTKTSFFLGEGDIHSHVHEMPVVSITGRCPKTHRIYI